MPKKMKPRSYDEALNQLKSLQFDVHEVPGVAGRAQVSKYGCAAIIGRGPRGGVAMFHKPGILMGNEIAILLDRGFQKFFKTSKLEMAATADRLKAEHRFAEELDEVIGEVSLYNESLGSVSDEYMYDRVKGRDTDAPPVGLAPWDTTGAAGGH
ncbi:MAG TPA: hypothetical protein VME86_09415 [Acidobacteriaceae bacterium]|nr:hypothetical protein [Acidobacteriaceae bacterium]